MSEQPTDDFRGFLLESMVAHDANDHTYTPCIIIQSIAEDGTALISQVLHVDALREMALNFMGAAEAAERDAAIMNALFLAGMSIEAIDEFMQALQ